MNGFSEARVAQVFGRLAAQAGLDAADYRPTRRWLKDDANRLHVVIRLDAEGRSPVIFKQALRPEDPAEFSGILCAHRVAARALDGAEGLTVPEILAEDRAQKACLMGFLPGETLQDLCLGHKDHTPYLRQAGRWLAAYHRGTFQEDRAFQPKFMARHMLRLAGHVEAGERRVWGRKRFVELAHRLQVLAAPHENRPSRIAAKHGDMNAHNLLIDGACVGGYDFLPVTHAPVGYDIARLLLSYAVVAASLRDIPNGAVLPPRALAAFFDGYDFVGPDDPGVQFLMRVQILTDWNRMADMKTARTRIRFERLKAIARRAFG